MLEYVMTQYGYLVILVGTFFEGEMVLVVGGLAAKLGYLELPWVMACAFTGTVLGDQLYFFIGRWYGPAMLKRRPHWRRRVVWINRHLERHHIPLILGFRYLYGIRTLVPFAIGMSTVPTLRFVALHVAGAALWAGGVGAAGYAFGNVAEYVLGDLHALEWSLLAVVIIVSIAGWAAYLRRRRRFERVVALRAQQRSRQRLGDSAHHEQARGAPVAHKPEAEESE